jgi:hypothetical protein
MEGDLRFDGRAILVTGGGRGLGRAQALLLAARGARVVVADNGASMDGGDPDKGPAEVVAAEIIAAGGEALAYTADLSDEGGAGEAVEASVRAFGRIDGIVHYASICPAPSAPDRLSTPVLDLVMRVNVYAGLFMARAAWPQMVRQQHGRIVYVPSAGSYGAQGIEYGTAKAAYFGMIRCLALDGAKQGILVNGISPAARTRMTDQLPDTPYSRWYRSTMAPEKVAVGAAYLLSEECDITGEVFAMGGGRIARVTLAEAEGVIGSGSSIEQVRQAMPRVMADTSFFHPRNIAERSARVAALFGFEVDPDVGGTYAKATRSRPASSKPE